MYGVTMLSVCIYYTVCIMYSMTKTKEFCDFGSNYGTCSTKDKNGNNMDTTKIRAVTYEVKVDGETYYTCKGCVTHFPFTAKNQDETAIYEVKSGVNVTSMFDTESINHT